MPLDEYREANRANWSERVAGHWEPDGYDASGFATDPDRISNVVKFDRPYLGEVSGKALLHLQCHFGMDTLSWAPCHRSVRGASVPGVAGPAPHDRRRRRSLEASRRSAGQGSAHVLASSPEARLIPTVIGSAPQW